MATAENVAILTRHAEAEEGLVKRDDEAFEALQTVRKALSVTDGIEGIIDGFLAEDPFPTLRKYLQSAVHEYVFEAAWIATNVASSTSAHCETLISAGVHEDLITLLTHPKLDVLEQAIWGLGNIAGDSARTRDLLLTAGIAPILCESFSREDAAPSFRGNVAWTLSNLCRAKPRPDNRYLAPIFELFERILREADERHLTHDKERQWIVDVLWAISYMSDGDDANIEVCLKHDLLRLVLRLFRFQVEAPGMADSEVVPRRIPCEQLGEVFEYLPRDDLLRLCTVCKDVFETTICDNATLYNFAREQFDFTLKEFRIPTLRIIGNVVTGNERQTDAALNAGALDLIEAIIANCGANIKVNEEKEIMWTLSNIAAGSYAQCGKLVARPRLVEALAHALQHKNAAVAKEASWVFGNLFSNDPKWLTATHVDDLGIVAMAVHMVVAIRPNTFSGSSATLIEQIGQAFAVERDSWDDREANAALFVILTLREETRVERDALLALFVSGADIKAIVDQTRKVWSLLCTDAKWSGFAKADLNLSLAMWGIYDVIVAATIGNVTPTGENDADEEEFENVDEAEEEEEEGDEEHEEGSASKDA